VKALEDLVAEKERELEQVKQQVTEKEQII